MKKIFVVLCLLIIVLPIFTMLSKPVEASTVHYGWMVDTDADATAFVINQRPSLATDSNSYFYLADNYYNSTYGRYGYNLRQSTDGGQHWSLIASRASSSYDIIIRNMAIDPTYNYIYLAFENYIDSSYSTVGVMTYNTTGFELHLVTIAATIGGVYINPCVTCEYQYGASNYVYFVYEYAYTSADRDLYFAYSANHGASFTTQPLQTGVDSTSSPWITEANATMYIAYIENATYGNGEGQVYLAYSARAPISWKIAAHIDGEVVPHCRSPVVAASHGGGRVLVAYEYDFSGTNYCDVDSAYSVNFGSTWTGPTYISHTSANETTPALSVDGQGSTSNSVYGYFHIAYNYEIVPTFVPLISTSPTPMQSEYNGEVMYARAGVNSPGTWDYLAYGSSPINDGPTYTAWPDGCFAVTTQLRSDGNWYPIVAWPDAYFGPSDTDIFTTTPEARANLASSQSDGSSVNLGSIIFNGTTYALPNNVYKEAGLGTYQASYVPASGYTFDHWVNTSGVRVSDIHANPTTVTVTNIGGVTPFGNLTAVYTKLFFVTFHVTNNPVGSITFSGTTYTSGQTGQYAAGNYSALANIPSGYSFYTWGYSGGVKVVGGLNPTTVQVTGNGSLDAELNAQVTFYTSPGNVGTIRWGADSPPDHTNGQSIYDYFYYNTVYVKATNVPGYTFAHWASSWSLTNATANPTNVTFTGPGWIEAYYLKNTYLVVRGNDNGIYCYDYGGSTWSGWIKITGSTLMSPAATVFNNKLQIVVVGADGSSLWYGNVDLANGIFSGWTRLSGATPSAPTLTSNGTALCLVVRGTDNRIYCSWYTSSWGPWQAVPTGTTGDTPAAAILGNDLHIVVRGTDGQSLWDTIVTYNGAVARGWRQLSGATPSRPVLASYSSSNKLYLVVRGSNNGIYYQAYNGSTDSWQGWASVPGATIDGPAATVANDDLYIAVRGTDGNTLWYGFVIDPNNTNNFSGWILLSGSTPSTPTLAS